MKCVLCSREAITTAAHIPVCRNHHEEYKHEASQYLTYRPFYTRLLEADEKRLAENAKFKRENPDYIISSLMPDNQNIVRIETAKHGYRFVYVDNPFAGNWYWEGYHMPVGKAVTSKVVGSFTRRTPEEAEKLDKPSWKNKLKHKVKEKLGKLWRR